MLGFLLLVLVMASCYGQVLDSLQDRHANHVLLDPEKVTVFWCVGDDLPPPDVKALRDGRSNLGQEVRATFAPLGVRVVFRDCSELSPLDRKALLASGLSCGRPTAFMVFLTGEKTPNGTYRDQKLLGMNVRNGSIFVFVKHLQADLRDDKELMFRIGQVTSHEIGHNLGFETYSWEYGWIKSLFNNKVLGTEGRGIPRSRTFFDANDALTARSVFLVNHSNVNGCAQYAY